MDLSAVNTYATPVQAQGRYFLVGPLSAVSSIKVTSASLFRPLGRKCRISDIETGRIIPSPPCPRPSSVTESVVLPPDFGDASNYAATVVCVTAAQCRDLADDHKGRAREAGISQKRAVLLTNIARSFSGLASQLEILAVDMAEEAHTRIAR